MKKGIVFGLIALALLVLLTPGIIGRVAEDRVQQNIDWAAEGIGDGELTVSAESFERSWFSSSGEHRISVSRGDVLGGLVNPDELPEFVITTHLDHGLIALSSLQREGGSLKPGLGSAASTIRVELPNGESYELPGTIYSHIGIGGTVDSTYQLAAGSSSFDDALAEWGETLIDFKTNPASGKLVVDGKSDGFSVKSADGYMQVGAMSVASKQVASKFGFSVGDYNIELATVSVSGDAAPGASYGPLSLKGKSSVDGDRVSGDTQLSFAVAGIPNVGDASLALDLEIRGLEGKAVKNLTDILDKVDDSIQANTLYALLETDLVNLMSGGFELELRQFDLDLPQGMVDSDMSIKLAATDAAAFSWRNVLMAMTAEANLSVPAQLVEMAMAVNPQAQMAVGLGFLQKQGDSYQMEAKYAQGMVNVNGAPFPVPMP